MACVESRRQRTLLASVAMQARPRVHHNPADIVTSLRPWSDALKVKLAESALVELKKSELREPVR